MFYQFFLSAQVKRHVIFSYKHGKYELTHELPNDLRLRILGNQEILGKCLNFVERQPSVLSSWQNGNFCQSQQKTLEKQKLIFSQSALFQLKTRVTLKYFVTDDSFLFRLILLLSLCLYLHFHDCVWGGFLRFIIKLVLCTHNFGSFLLKPLIDMISDRKVRSVKTKH